MKVKWRLFGRPMLTLPSLAPQLQFPEDSATRPNWQEGSESSIPTINENSNHIYYLVYWDFLWLYFLKISNMLLPCTGLPKSRCSPHFSSNLHPVAEAHSWTMWRAMARGRNWEILWKWRPLRRSWARWGVGESVTDSRAERAWSVSSTLSGRPHLAGLCEGEHGPLEHCCRRITRWGKKKIFQTSGVRWKLFIVLYHSRLSLSLSSFQECLVLWSQRLSQI